MGRGFRLRGIDNLDERLKQIPYLLATADLAAWSEIFPRPQPVYLEIGMGRGKFIYHHALRHPERNFIGLDQAAILLLKASQRMEALSNLRLLLADFSAVHHQFPDGSLAGIFLNFSDPWPKKRHHKRRLTHRRFLDYYDRLLQPGGQLVFKTDRVDLFDFTLAEFAATGRAVCDVTRNLQRDPRYSDNIPTEYETKFSLMGHPILGLRYIKP